MTDGTTTGAARLAARVTELRASPPFQNYLRAREAVLRMLDDGAGSTSAYWREELENIEYMLDASPLVVERLRHHCFHITGVRVYEYRSGQSAQRKRFEQRLTALRERGGDELMVPESPQLGGFGFPVDGGLFNLDTIKYFESMLALRKSGVLPLLQRARSVVCEIGGGWGGMAYQIKTIAPQTAYVIVDLPELFLFSATYLATLFPEATIAFWGDDVDWDVVDFVFVPNTAVQDYSPPRVDVGLNTVSFQEMTTDQVETYVRRFHEWGCTTVYSLNRERSVYNDELTSVTEILGARYDLTEVTVLDMPYNRMGVDAGLKERLARLLGKRDNEYRHVVGRRQT